MLQSLGATLGVLSLAYAHAAPHMIRLQAVAPRKDLSLGRRALDPTTIPLVDHFLGTDLQ